MKSLLRKNFFWDEPLHGAFFGLTQLLLTHWVAFSVLCACLVAHSRIFRFTAVAVAFSSLFILSCLYCLFLVFRGVVGIIKHTPRFWRRLLKMLAAVLALTPLCAVFAYNLLPETSNGGGFGTIDCIQPGVFRIALSLHPHRPSRETAVLPVVLDRFFSGFFHPPLPGKSTGGQVV